ATGGQVPGSNNYEEKATVTIAANPGNLEKTGFMFAGWNTQADGKGTHYAANDTFKMGLANVTLYAKWDVASYVLSFESNGGSVVVAQNVANQTRAKMPIAPTKTGYIFAGWYKDTALTTAWNFKTDMVTKPTTLYAKWTVNSSSGSGGDYNPTPTPPPIEPTPEQPTPPGNPKEEPKPQMTFTDILAHWAQEMIEDIAARGIINGYPDGSFRPNDPITREHIAAMIARAFDLEPTREATSFSDVPNSHPYYEAIMQLQQAGIIDGSDGAYNPDAPMTRAQMAKVIVLAFGLTPGGTSTFQDVAKTHWSYDYIAALEAHGIALGDNGNFNPDEPVTRAEFVAFLYRAFHL
ncbi:S-layer homology domain-containing protein, partial [Solibacillus cecembensis]|uniref:S-layer homology domain-containing protein n=1 Tax=Solibacillus cecembensis TaxID=459347 RepID=UPI003D07F99E